jgi:hypothetical protein
MQVASYKSQDGSSFNKIKQKERQKEEKGTKRLKKEGLLGSLFHDNE